MIEDDNFVVGYFAIHAIIDSDKVPNKDIDGEIASIYMHLTTTQKVLVALVLISQGRISKSWDTETLSFGV